MDRLKLKWKIFAFLLGFCALLLIILWFFQTILLTRMYKFIRTRELEKSIALIVENIDSPDLQTIVNDLEINKEIFVMPTQKFVPPSRPQYNRGDKPRHESIEQTVEFTMQDGQVIPLTFFAIVSPVDATVSTLHMQLYIITGIMIFLAIIIAIIISRRISKPIEDINNSAKVLAAGNYDAHFSGKGFLEIEELSDTLNGAAAELSKVEALRRELISNISHDLRTPLALIFSYAEMMHDFPDEVTPEQTQIIMDETKRLTSLVNDVLNVSQLEVGMMELNRSIYNLTESVSASIERITELIKKDGYSLTFEHVEDVYVDADEVKITQVIYNLLTNAIHYSGKDKNITVRQNVCDGNVKLEVVDNGEGIAPEDLPYIWERYYKVDKKHKRAIAGTGLGLSIVQKIIKLHGGECGVESELGKGSTFWFEIKRGQLR